MYSAGIDTLKETIFSTLILRNEYCNEVTVGETGVPNVVWNEEYSTVLVLYGQQSFH